MRVISIDVGIKNLAYCILEQNTSSNTSSSTSSNTSSSTSSSTESNTTSYTINKWDVINLCGQVHLCNCLLKKKASIKADKASIKANKASIKADKASIKADNASIKTDKMIDENIICNKKASYLKNINGTMQYYCQVHAKQSEYLLPNSSLKNIKSWKRDALVSYAAAQNIVLPENITITKDILIKHINVFLVDKVLDKISAVSANDMTLIQMGVKLVKEFDKVLESCDMIDHIVIENQISPIANRMKTLQGMIAQYFIMRDKPTISFISSANKLKLFKKDKLDVAVAAELDVAVAAELDAADNVDIIKIKPKDNGYSERKKESVNIVKELLENNKSIVGNWQTHFLTHKKKDDLADAFLQGAWYLSKIV